jgi:hypothetical protein
VRPEGAEGLAEDFEQDTHFCRERLDFMTSERYRTDCRRQDAPMSAVIYVLR